MPSDLRPTVRRLPERDQESWKRILTALSRRKRPSMAFWMTVGSALAATVLLFVLLATQATEPEAIAEPTSAPILSALPPETKAAEAAPREPTTTPATVTDELPPKPSPKVAPSASASAAPQPSSSSSTKMFDRRW